MSKKKRLTAEVETKFPEMDSRDAKRFCPKCGREIPLDQELCVFCSNTGEIPRPKFSKKRKVMLLCVILLILIFLLAFSLWLTRGYQPEIPADPTEIIRGTVVPVNLIQK